MKILLVGNMGRSMNATADECALRDAFRRLGHEVLDYHWHEFEKILQDRPKVNFTLMSKGATPEQIKQLRELTGAPVFYWCFDLMGARWPETDPFKVSHPHWRAALEADGYFGKGLCRAHLYRELGIKFFFLPEDVASAAFERVEPDPVQAKRLKLAQEKYPVLFTGTWLCHGINRPKVLKELETKIAPIPLWIFSYNGGAWCKVNRFQPVGFQNVHGGVYDGYYGELIARTQINLAIDWWHGCEGYWSNRVAKILSCGGFVLAKYTLGMERAFGPDEETLIYWSDLDECADKIRYYLKHESEREEIAERGYQFAKKYLTKDYRLRQLLTILKYTYGIG